MRITEVARDWIDLRMVADELVSTGQERTAERYWDAAEVARAEIERRLAELFAAGAR